MEIRKCAFTGHRPQRLPGGYNEQDTRCVMLKKVLKEEIIRLIERDGVTYFITGMALGVDMYAAEIILSLKSKYDGLTLEAAVPFFNQANKWPIVQQARYGDIISKCDKVTLIQREYSADCLHKRNKYMVDQADIIIAVWDGGPSGTGKTVGYAKEQGKPVFIINPKSIN